MKNYYIYFCFYRFQLFFMWMYVHVYFKESWQNLRLFGNVRKWHNYYFWHNYGHIESKLKIFYKYEKYSFDSQSDQWNIPQSQ